VRIAILNPYEGVAETESVTRIRIGCQRIGVTATECRTSEQANDLRPDLVLSIAHQDAKLTRYPTYGVLTAPVGWYTTRRFIRNILTYDGYLTVSRFVARWLETLCRSARKNARVGFYANTCPATEFRERGIAPASLVYMGTNWDSQSFAELFEGLAGRDYMRIHGPPDRWQHVRPEVFLGRLPFDGESAIAAYRDAGAGLCLHLNDFIVDGLPNNRIFEVTAAGAVAICDANPFCRDNFGDSALYLDHEQAAADVLAQVDRHMEWIAAHPDEALEKARRAHGIFNDRFSLERLLGNVLEFHDAARGYRASLPAAAKPAPAVSVLMPLAGGDGESLVRSLESLERQTVGRVEVIAVFKEGDQAVLAALRAYAGSLPVRHCAVPGEDAGALLWAGLRCIESEYFGVADSGDEWFPEHVAALLGYAARLRESKGIDARLVYAGNIERGTGPIPELLQDDHALRRSQTLRVGRFSPLGIDVTLPEILSGKRAPAARCAWLARSDLLDEDILAGPGVSADPHALLFALLAEKSRPWFCPEVTTASPAGRSAAQRPGWRRNLDGNDLALLLRQSAPDARTLDIAASHKMPAYEWHGEAPRADAQPAVKAPNLVQPRPERSSTVSGNIVIDVQGVNIEFPLYGIGARSLKKTFMRAATGGKVARDAADRVVVQALRGLSFMVHEGERVGLYGPNGSGKTTLLRVLAGVFTPTAGTARIHGRVAPMLDVFVGIDQDATGLENIVMRGLVMGLSRREILERMPDIVAFSELGDYVHLPVRSYSSGMSMRLAFAIATAVPAEIILMDEWLSVGDQAFVRKAESRLNGLITASRACVIASHNFDLLKHVCNRVLFLEGGTIVDQRAMG
jgi:lipopolysaccharide transport system ATP-binding protein